MVSGATLNDIGLSLVVADLRKAKTNDDSVRCNVEFGDRQVLKMEITYRDSHHFCVVSYDLYFWDERKCVP